MTTHKKFVAPNGKIYMHCNIGNRRIIKVGVVSDDWDKVTCKNCLKQHNRKAIR